jgi:hypothetical protein
VPNPTSQRASGVAAQSAGGAARGRPVPPGWIVTKETDLPEGASLGYAIADSLFVRDATGSNGRLAIPAEVELRQIEVTAPLSAVRGFCEQRSAIALAPTRMTRTPSLPAMRKAPFSLHGAPEVVFRGSVAMRSTPAAPPSMFALIVGFWALAGRSFAQTLGPEVVPFIAIHEPTFVLQHVRVIDGTGAPARRWLRLLPISSVFHRHPSFRGTSCGRS